MPTRETESDTTHGDGLELHDVVMPVLLKVLALAAEHGRWGTVDAVLGELKARRLGLGPRRRSARPVTRSGEG